MAKFTAAYAYDIPCYFRFTVEAPDEITAKEKIDRFVAEKKFDDVACTPEWDCQSDNRAFIICELPEGSEEVDIETIWNMEAISEALDRET